jgi:hypothetical protein
MKQSLYNREIPKSKSCTCTGLRGDQVYLKITVRDVEEQPQSRKEGGEGRVGRATA